MVSAEGRFGERAAVNQRVSSRAVLGSVSRAQGEGPRGSYRDITKGVGKGRLRVQAGAGREGATGQFCGPEIGRGRASLQRVDRVFGIESEDVCDEVSSGGVRNYFRENLSREQRPIGRVIYRVTEGSPSGFSTSDWGQDKRFLAGLFQ